MIIGFYLWSITLVSLFLFVNALFRFSSIHGLDKVSGIFYGMIALGNIFCIIFIGLYNKPVVDHNTDKPVISEKKIEIPKKKEKISIWKRFIQWIRNKL